MLFGLLSFFFVVLHNEGNFLTIRATIRLSGIVGSMVLHLKEKEQTGQSFFTLSPAM
jgi:hypothetical protein